MSQCQGLQDFDKAYWIWYPQHKRNSETEYICFRKEIFVEQEVEEAVMHITADTRYKVWINDETIGQGPVRGWTDKWFYDTYDVVSCLKPGRNIITVLVYHINIGTFQYLPSRGGLLVRLTGIEASGRKLNMVSDNSWKCKYHTSYDGNTPRISCQQGYAEHYDACMEPEGWMYREYNASNCWNQVVIVGKVGCEPWIHLIPRDIPFLTEDEVYPVRVHSSRIVEVEGAYWNFNLRPWLLEGYQYANPMLICGMIVTTVTVSKPVRVRFCFQDRTTGLNMHLQVNGKEILPTDESGIHWSGLYYFEVQLEAGQHLLNFWANDIAHEWSFNVIIKKMDMQGEYMVEPVIPGNTMCRFAVIGPFNKEQEEQWETFQLAKKSNSWNEIVQLSLPLKMIPKDCEYTANVFNEMVMSKEDEDEECHIDNLHLVCSGSRDAMILDPASKEKRIEIVFEFEKMMYGLIEFEVFGEEGTVLDFYGIEAYQNGDVIHTWSVNNTMRYTLKKGWQRYRSILQRGFRYLILHVHGNEQQVKLRYVRCILRTYPAPLLGNFRCSDALLQKIFDISRWTARLCSDDTFIDCPTYEQAFWVGDAYITGAITQTLFGASHLVKRCLRLAAQSMKRSPIVESQVPSSWENILTTWSLLYIIACDEYYRVQGDIEFIKEIYPSMIGQIQYINAHLKDKTTGLIRSSWWNLLDWAPLDTPSDGIVTHINALFVETCRRTSNAAHLLGYEKDVHNLKHLIEHISLAINLYLWDEKQQAFVDCLREDISDNIISEQTNTICYLCDVALPERKAIIKSYIGHAPENFEKTVNPFMLFFTLDAMSQENNYKDMFNIMRKTWGYMVENDSTTCWEDMPGRWAPGYLARSHCHVWSAAPAYYLPRVVLGIKPLKPGFDNVEIHPQIDELEWAAGRITTPKGEIEVEWEYQPRQFTTRVVLPAGVSGELILPVSSALFVNVETIGISKSNIGIRYGKWVVALPEGAKVKVTASKTRVH